MVTTIEGPIKLDLFFDVMIEDFIIKRNVFSLMWKARIAFILHSIIMIKTLLHLYSLPQ